MKDIDLTTRRLMEERCWSGTGHCSIWLDGAGVRKRSWSDGQC